MEALSITEMPCQRLGGLEIVLPPRLLGQTVGQGATAAITLDQNAAGHGWYVDPTPLHNADDYLPTSQSGVWQAKAGSAAAGKMDMLSVLLHEYGHALGLEHSGNGADFMAASLQPGVRKLPSSEELVLMGQLVAQLKAQQGAADPAALSPASTSALLDHRVGAAISQNCQPRNTLVISLSAFEAQMQTAGAQGGKHGLGGRVALPG